MRTAPLIRSTLAALLLSGAGALLAAQTATTTPCPLGNAPGLGRSLSSAERAEQRTRMQKWVADLQKKRAAGSITAEEQETLGKLEQRGAPCITGDFRGRGAGLGLGGPGCGRGQGQWGRGPGMGRGPGGQGLGRGPGVGPGGGACLQNVPFGAISQDAADSLQFANQQEKMARDVYQALAVKWNHPVLRNIAVAEQRHMDAVGRLIAGYGLEDGSPAEPGLFTIPEVQAFYDRSVAAGAQSLADALKVGVAIEEADIADLEKALQDELDAPIERVFGNQLQASRNHLAAFRAALAQVENAASPRKPAASQKKPVSRAR